VKFKWVYHIKFGANGKPNRFKACLVAKGFTQILGLDYDETFSPVAYLDLIWILLALAMLEDWEIHQIDIKTAFLNSNLNKEIYMQQLEGFIAAGQSGKVCRLRKALYGLKQAS
jgi:Reverse transcriptase (RNA-dependent DNA polymerase)